MVDDTVELTQPHGRRMEIRGKIAARRRWPDEEKARIVAESLAPGAVVSEIAQRYQILPRNLWAWRKASREGRLALATNAEPAFVPVVGSIMHSNGSSSSTLIVIEVAGAVVRAGPGVDLALLCDVLRAVKAVA